MRLPDELHILLPQGKALCDPENLCDILFIALQEIKFEMIVLQDERLSGSKIEDERG